METEPTATVAPEANAQEVMAETPEPLSAVEDDGDDSADDDAAPTARQREQLPYPLAFDASGNPVKVPPNARAWRVRAGGGKRGRPRNVFDATTGRQLEIPLGASIEDLIAANVPADRYLLYPVDGEGTIIPGVIAVTEVQTEDDDDDARDEVTSTQAKDPIVATLVHQQETIRSQHDVIKAQSEQLARALASAVSGYAPVRPVAPPPPVIMEAPAAVPPPPAPEAGGILAGLANVKPEQVIGLFMVVKQAYEMFRGMSAGGGMPGVGAPP
jgi:hypothetical protein